MTEKVDGRRNNRPPAEHQFKPGQSGNPPGRPKKRPREYSESQFLRDFLHISDFTVMVDVGRGKKKMLTYAQACMLRMFTKAVNGDNVMLKAIVPLLTRAYDQNQIDNRGAFTEIRNIMEHVGSQRLLYEQPIIMDKLDKLRARTKPL